MTIIDKDNLLTNTWKKSIVDVANMPFKIEGFGSLEEIHKKENVAIVIESKTNERAILHQEAKKKLYNELDSPITASRREKILRLLESISRIIVLGEYKPKENNIYLYIDTIKSMGKDTEKYVLTTYVHEMMHAYFDRIGHKQFPYVYEVEETLAEAGMLLFLDETQHPLLAWAVRNVKKKSPVLEAYAKGAVLYENWKQNHTDLYVIVKKYKVLNFNVLPNINSRYKRDCFEDWLLSIGKSPSSAAYNACYLPLLRSIKEAVNYITKGQTDCIFDIVSLQELSRMRSLIGSPDVRYHKLIELYVRYLYTTGRILP